MEKFEIQAAGDRAFRLSFSKDKSEKTNERVIEAAYYIRSHRNPAIKEVLPSYSTLLIRYDPVKMAYSDMRLFLESTVESLKAGLKRKKKIINIPVCFEKEFGPDLEYVATNAGMTEEEAVSLFCSKEYRVYFFGKMPGFSFSPGLDPKLKTEKRAIRHKLIEPGSIVIWDLNVGIYNLPFSGNQRIVGKTPLELFKEDRKEIFSYRAGDYLKFVPVSEEEFKQIKESVKTGTYQMKVYEEEAVWE